ncbi:hypothetical protein AB0H07_46475 [Streptomyces sp. NPDC021354]|uniref:hypothetical protein n=1 Tax=Streptomyces sp. NPDC021354 TaxID=3154793 RepID=UPI0033E69C8E
MDDLLFVGERRGEACDGVQQQGWLVWHQGALSRPPKPPAQEMILFSAGESPSHHPEQAGQRAFVGAPLRIFAEAKKALIRMISRSEG